MDIVISYYNLFSYPFHRKSYAARSSNKFRRIASLIWCNVCLILLVYHYSHTWLRRYTVRLIGLFIVPNNFNIVYFIIGILNITIEFIIPVSIKFYLLFVSKSQAYQKFYNFYDAIKSIQTNSQSRRYRNIIFSILLVHTIISSCLGFTLLIFINDCLKSKNICLAMYLTYGVDHALAIMGSILIITALSLVPVVMCVVCLELSACLDLDMLDLERLLSVMDLMDKYLQLRNQISGYLFALLNCITLQIIFKVVGVARSPNWSTIHFNMGWAGMEFALIALVCCASSHADQAVS